MAVDLQDALTEIRGRVGMSQQRLATLLGTSLASVAKWQAGTAQPSPEQFKTILELRDGEQATASNPFASRGVRRGSRGPSLFDAEDGDDIQIGEDVREPILERITSGPYFLTDSPVTIDDLIERHPKAARTAASPPGAGMSAGKNTYTYDAHTYHTKVPPQGIAELVRHYLPSGGLVLDPFAGSGMTGVATAALGHDCILNELSPAACFIASRFVSKVSASALLGAIDLVLSELAELRSQLYTTTCRECSKSDRAPLIGPPVVRLGSPSPCSTAARTRRA